MNGHEFQSFYEQHARRLWAYAARITGNPSAADDIVQESFLRLLAVDKLGEMNPDHQRNYLYAIAANLMKKQFRVRIREMELADLSSMEFQRDKTEQAIAIRQALDQMNPKEQNLLWLAYVEGFSHRQIAQIAGYAESSIRPLLHRARVGFLQLLGIHGREKV
jgi:RNA polymerase sigma-70 factor, ECF subfamily